MTGSQAGGAKGRRRSHVAMPASYASVGATQLPDLMKFPPSGSSAYEEELRLGSGEERFMLASSLLMTWGAQRGAGATVDELERGPENTYDGVQFDDDGVPHTAPDREDTFAPDGSLYLNAGTTAVITYPGQKPRRMLVVYTVNEERCVGFALGSGDDLGVIGEQRFVVEWRADDTVWAVARGFLVAARSGLLGLKARADLRDAIELVKAQIQVLSPVAAGVANTQAASDAEAVPQENAETVAEPVEPVEPVDVAEADPVDVAEVESENEAAAETSVPSEENIDAEATVDGQSAPMPHQRRPSRQLGEQDN